MPVKARNGNAAAIPMGRCSGGTVLVRFAATIAIPGFLPVEALGPPQPVKFPEQKRQHGAFADRPFPLYTAGPLHSAGLMTAPLVAAAATGFAVASTR